MQTAASPDPVASPKAYQDLLVSLVGDDDPAEVQARTPTLSAPCWPTPGPMRTADLKPASGRSPNAWLYMLDAELVVSGRYRWILAHDQPELLGYDQDLWVDHLHHPVEGSERDAGDLRGDAPCQPGALGADPGRAARSVRDPSRKRAESYGLTFTLAAGHGRFHLDLARRALEQIRSS